MDISTIFRTIAFAIISICISISATATERTQSLSEEMISLTFNIDSINFNKTEKAGLNYYNIKIDGFTELIGEGIPAVLKRVERFEIPEDKDISKFEITCVCDTISMLLAPADLPKADKLSHNTPVNNKINDITPYDGVWPEECAKLLNTSLYRDCSVGSLAIYPIRYDYNSQKIVICKNITINISFSEIGNAYIKKIKSLRTSKHKISENAYKAAFTINSFNDDTEENSNPKRAIVLPGSGGSGNGELCPYLLIIAPREYGNQAQKLAMWRRRNGVNVKVITDDKSKLASPDYTKGLIEDFYDMEDDLQYVLLMGEGNWIKPFEGKFPVQVWNQQLNAFETLDYYTDFYFGCMDGDDDYESDLIIGRLPARTSDEMNAMVDKIIHYEGTPSEVLGASTRSDMLISEFGGNGTQDTDDFVPVTELIAKHMPKTIGYKLSKIYYADNDANPQKWKTNSIAGSLNIPTELKKPAFLWDGSPADIINQINEGCHVVLYRGHGAIDQWGYMGFKANNVSQLNNYDRLPVMFGITCLSGMFYQPRLYRVFPNNVSGNMSMSIRMLGTSQKGAVAFIGANQESFSGYNEYLAVGLYGTMFPQYHFDLKVPGENECNSDDFLSIGKKRLGDIFEGGCKWIISGYGDSETSSTYKYVRYSRDIYHCLGDPSMRVNMNNCNKQPLNIVIENGQRISKDPRQIVLVNKNNLYVSTISSGYNQNLDELMETYYVSFADDIHTPILLNEDTYNQGSMQNVIDSVNVEGTTYNIKYNSNSDNVIFKLFDIYGNLIDSTVGQEGTAILSSGNTIGIITMESDNCVIDSIRVIPN